MDSFSKYSLSIARGKKVPVPCKYDEGMPAKAAEFVRQLGVCSNYFTENSDLAYKSAYVTLIFFCDVTLYVVEDMSHIRLF